jgi:hypothetical protein
MIIGRGSIGSIIDDKEGYLFFANGISNRTSTTEESKNREKLQILEHLGTNDMFVYVSGLNVYYTPESEYTKHKIDMEDLVKDNFKNYCIFRIGSITWGNNPNTIVNFIRKKIQNGEEMEIQDVYRYLHTKEELTHWFNMIPSKGKHEMNVTGRMIKVSDIVKEIIENKI